MFIHNLDILDIPEEKIYRCKTRKEFKRIEKLGFEPISKNCFLITEEFRLAVLT